MTTNDTQWSAMYAALIDQLSLSREAFQLLYPFTGWNWPATSLGYTSAAEYDFCSTTPQWSATGAYASSGKQFSDGYRMFLSIIDPITNDQGLAAEIKFQQNIVQEKRNAYDLSYQKASRLYQEATDGSNEPLFAIWLTTQEAKTIALRLELTWSEYLEAIEKLDGLLVQTQTPGLVSATENFTNTEYYTKYQSPALSAFPEMPGYGISQSMTQWVNSIKDTGGNPITVRFSVPLDGQASHYNDTDAYEGTWAGYSNPVPYSFFGEPSSEAVAQPFDKFPELSLAENEIEINIHFEAWTTISITPNPWYSPEFVSDRQNGPFIRGYTAHPNADDVYLWGQGGAFNLRKTAMLVAYNPVFEILHNSMAHKTLQRMFSNAEQELRVGPFVGQLSDPVSPFKLSQFQKIDTATSSPSIFGVNVEVMPG